MSNGRWFHTSGQRHLQENGISHNEGYILISNKNEKFYVIVITTSRFKVNKNLKGNLYKNHIKYLINNLEISQKHIPFNLDNLIESFNMSEERNMD